MLFDTHAHLYDEQFGDRVEDVIERARQAGVRYMLCVGTTLTTSRQSIELAERFPEVYAAVGIHPNHAAEAADGDWEQIVRLAAHPRVRALGETGLDRYWDDSPFPLQQDYLDRHLQLSQQTGLPFVLHMRDCQDDVMEMLSAAHLRGPLNGIMHSYTGNAEGAVECVGMGLHISFAGMVTYKKSDDLRAIAAQVPADRLLIETDSPYLSPHPHRSVRPNEPAMVRFTAECVAASRQMTLDELARITTENACRLFQIKNIA